MIFAEAHARLLLVVHAVVGGALVAAATHLVVWMRGWPRGRFSNRRGVRRFAVIVAALFVAQFALGNALYPVYKVRARVEYLDNSPAVARDYHARQRARADIARQREIAAAARAGRPLLSPPAGATARATSGPATATGSAASARIPDVALTTAKVARWFDVKEHWVGLALPLALALAVVLWVYDPRRHGEAVAPLLFGMAVAVAAATWLAAIVGLVTTSFRSIGGL